MIEKQRVATLWYGHTLPKLDQCCLSSFIYNNFDVTVFSYTPWKKDLPNARYQNAAEILSAEYLQSFQINGKPSLSHFSDLFRYMLFRKTDMSWIDTDLFCLRPFRIPTDHHFVTRETPDRVNGAILKLLKHDGMLERLIEEVISLSDKPFAWGATGPSLMTKHLGATEVANSPAPEVFYPFHWSEWWMPLLPSHQKLCMNRAAGSNAIHLWNNILERSGYWKDLAPPANSYLSDLISQQGLSHLFEQSLPEHVMENIARNSLNLETAAHMPIKKIAHILARRSSSWLLNRVPLHLLQASS